MELYEYKEKNKFLVELKPGAFALEKGIKHRSDPISQAALS